MKGVLAAAFAALLAIACGDENPTAAPRPETTTSTASDGAITDCRGLPQDGSSPATFDAATGTYASIPTDFDKRSHRISFDVVQWLSGEEANDAYEAETGDPSGAPNDYYVLNESPKLRTAEVATDADLFVLKVDGHADSLMRIDPEKLATHLRSSNQNIYWLTFSAGSVTEICQQYRP